MNQVGIVLSIFFGLCCLGLYLKTIDIWNFAFKLHPESLNLNDMIERNAGRASSIIHQILLNVMIFIGIIGSLISCSKLGYLLFGEWILIWLGY